jgi:hypothetical protein
VIARARGVLYGTQFHQNYTNVLKEISQNMNWPFRSPTSNPRRRTALYQTSYPPFFDSWTEQCNNAKFFGTILGKKVTIELRDKLNLLGQELNYVISSWIDQHNYIATAVEPGWASGDAVDFVKFADQDDRYSGTGGHRFCRDGIHEPRKPKIVLHVSDGY